MKTLYKSAKVVHNGHKHSFEVYYRNFLVWRHDRSYPYDTDANHTVHYMTQAKAREAAIARAEGLLTTIEIWRKSNYFTGY